MITLNDVKADALVDAYIARADEYLEVIGYTEHGRRHCGMVARNARKILLDLGHSEREAELSAIAGYLHDIGNVFNRVNHPFTGAMLAHTLLLQMGMDPMEITQIVAAIGNHDEVSCEPINAVASGLIIADKSDVHRSRVRNPEMIKFDIHDRVNYAVEKSSLVVDAKQRIIRLELSLDTKISPVAEYFEIFLSRMLFCRKAAKFLGCQFNLVANGTDLL
ncbi:MAG: HD domain-containing protein [candidate division KSB1 bacterium]|nr:HD domain-containing protein [candidate division KSB1 bacterium]MDZ7275347.1 HD domain-containing protein [candidate division KSB1 bacterium]MDZ7287514.1 HD domain-containing protein [candidate division KSB1 bacterium]MDZ7299628.1 HD domain-containing protein [candidate division KSB1 bacterium]MDZ7307421.1 HD domain-containing protein [candidate division KSB1 bacterium]